MKSFPTTVKPLHTLLTVIALLVLAPLASAQNLADKPPQTPTPAKPASPTDEKPAPPADAKLEYVLMTTSKGEIVLELNREKAPITVANFLGYVADEFYDGTIFHRVIDNFMIQGGGMTREMTPKPTKAPIKNEWQNGLKNERGTIAMARTNNPDSATAQFYINVKDNPSLNGPGGNPGYAVFGKVIAGMNVVDAIKLVRTGRHGPHGDVPVDPIVIEKVRRITKDQAEAAVKAEQGAKEDKKDEKSGS